MPSPSFWGLVVKPRRTAKVGAGNGLSYLIGLGIVGISVWRGFEAHGLGAFVWLGIALFILASMSVDFWRVMHGRHEDDGTDDAKDMLGR